MHYTRKPGYVKIGPHARNLCLWAHHYDLATTTTNKPKKKKKKKKKSREYKSTHTCKTQFQRGRRVNFCPPFHFGCELNPMILTLVNLYPVRFFCCCFFVFLFLSCTALRQQQRLGSPWRCVKLANRSPKAAHITATT